MDKDDGVDDGGWLERRMKVGWVRLIG